MDWVGVAVWVVCLSPIWIALVMLIWEGEIRPRLIPKEEIEELASGLVAKHGARAAEIAFIEEDRAWRYSHSFEQGKWRRVRRHIMRTYQVVKEHTE